VRWPRYGQMKASGAAWLGEVPGHWGVKRLRFALAMNPSSREARHLAPEDEVSFVPMEAVGERGGLDLVATRPAADFAGTYTYFRDDDVVVAKITPCFENGKGAHAKGLVNGAAIGTTELHVLRPHSTALDPRFLFYLSISQPFRALGEASMYGAGGPKRVPDTFIKDFRAPLPPIDEQRAIAAFLDRETARIDSLVAAKRRLIALLQEKRAALIARAVTRGLDPAAPTKDSGLAWLGRVPAHWDVMPLKRSVKWITSGSRGWAGHYSDDGDLFLRIGNLTRDSIHLDLSDVQRVSAPAGAEGERTLAQAGDLVLSITAYLGSVAVVPTGLESTFVSQHVALARPRRELADPRWLAFALLSTPGQQQLQAAGYGGTKVQLGLDDVLSVIITMPPIDEQRRVCDQLEAKTEALKAGTVEVERTIARLTEYRSTLITSAVTGRIDVRAPS